MRTRRGRWRRTHLVSNVLVGWVLGDDVVITVVITLSHVSHSPTVCLILPATAGRVMWVLWLLRSSESRVCVVSQPAQPELWVPTWSKLSNSDQVSRSHRHLPPPTINALSPTLVMSAIYWSVQVSPLVSTPWLTLDVRKKCFTRIKVDSPGSWGKLTQLVGLFNHPALYCPSSSAFVSTFVSTLF